MGNKIINTLVVDDSMVTRNHISRALSKIEGVKIMQIAKNGQEAVAFVQKQEPDFITMDLTMPEMDGIETIKEILKIHPNAVILVISALADKETAIEALSLGAVGFLYKPFTDDQLIEAAKEAISSDEDE